MERGAQISWFLLLLSPMAVLWSIEVIFDHFVINGACKWCIFGLIVITKLGSPFVALLLFINPWFLILYSTTQEKMVNKILTNDSQIRFISTYSTFFSEELGWQQIKSINFITCMLRRHKRDISYSNDPNKFEFWITNLISIFQSGIIKIL